MITRFKQDINIPYSLHDMLVNKITYIEKSIYLEFSIGYIATKAPYKQIDGKIMIENMDIDSC